MKKLLLLLMFIPLISFTQAGFKLRKFKDKLSSKALEIGLEKGMGLDHFGKLAALEYENYHYRYENEIYSFTLDFNSAKKADSYKSIKLTIRNKSDKDIVFGSKNKRKRVDAREIEGVITMPNFDFIVITAPIKRKGFSEGLKRGRVYAKGDPKSFSDIELSSIYINYEPLGTFEEYNKRIASLDLVVEYNKRITEEYSQQELLNKAYLKSIGRASGFPDEIIIRYENDINYFWPQITAFKSEKWKKEEEERLVKEGKINYITLTANPNWSRKWRNSDPDYQKKLSDFMVQNDVAIFGKKKNKKKKKKKNKKK
jgi:hypothetical protein